ncbi:MAG: LCP family protein [Eggerthellaceae bacterium]|nr:LCP family protein [Eggerthellaceae bacterium]
MVRRTKGFSHARSRRKLPHVNSVTVGTHVPRLREEDSPLMGVGGEVPDDTARLPGVSAMPQDTFSNVRKAERARKGILDHITPDTETGETTSEAEKRVNKPTYAETRQRHARARAVTITVSILTAVIVIAAGIGAFAYAGSINDKMALDDSNAHEALESVEKGEPYYILFAAEFFEPGQEYVGPSLLMLARIDEAEKRVSLLAIPPSLQVLLSDGEYRRLSEAQLLGGDAELIDLVSEFIGAPISHFVKTDRESFVELIDALGGLEIDVAQEVDDPQAGAIYIPAGQQVLSGEEALILARATNFINGDEVRFQNQGQITIALGQKLLEKNSFGLALTFNKVAKNIATDFSLTELMRIADALRGIEAESIQNVQVPGYFETSTFSGIRYFIVAKTAWGKLQESFETGEEAAVVDVGPVVVDPTTFTITVRNGSGVTGSASQVANLLGERGFQVEEIGNADLYVYEETLIVYHSSEYAHAAESVVRNLGIGRAIVSYGFYAFDTDVLVVIGKDWKPLN